MKKDLIIILIIYYPIQLIFFSISMWKKNKNNYKPK